MDPQIEAMLEDIEKIIRVENWQSLSFPEQAGLFAALKSLCNSLREVLDQNKMLTGYAAEKLGNVKAHGAGIFGFGEYGRMDSYRQRDFAYAELSSLISEIELKFQ